LTWHRELMLASGKGATYLDAPNPASEPAVRCSIAEGDR
jgi:hypothetical protein